MGEVDLVIINSTPVWHKLQHRWASPFLKYHLGNVNTYFLKELDICQASKLMKQIKEHNIYFMQFDYIACTVQT